MKSELKLITCLSWTRHFSVVVIDPRFRRRWASRTRTCAAASPCPCVSTRRRTGCPHSGRIDGFKAIRFGLPASNINVVDRNVARVGPPPYTFYFERRPVDFDIDRRPSTALVARLRPKDFARGVFDTQRPHSATVHVVVKLNLRDAYSWASGPVISEREDVTDAARAASLDVHVITRTTICRGRASVAAAR